MGLEDVLNARAAEFVGILNGVDYGIWSPDRDPFLPHHYDATHLAPKRRIKSGCSSGCGSRRISTRR